MALGFARAFGQGKIEAHSAGSQPSGRINPDAVKVMKESDIDISSYRPKGFNEHSGILFDYVITLGCGDVCPFYSAGKHVEWDIEDPKGKDLIFFRKVRDQIKDKVVDLIKEIKD